MTNAKPLRELSRENQIDLLTALLDDELDILVGNQWCQYSGLLADHTYRRRPKPVTKPSIDVAHVAAEWKWLARNRIGSIFLHRKRPFVNCSSWITHGEDIVADARIFASYDPGTCDWRESLVDLDAIRRERGLI
jgi:hypothetical protein